MVRKTQFITLLAGICLSFSLSAQNFTRHNWYFTNNDQALIFGKEDDAMAFLDDGKVPQANAGEKLTVTDPLTGDLLFYSDGINIYDATHQVMQNGNGIVSDGAGIQALASTLVPSLGGGVLYYFLHRDAAGNLLYTVIDMSLPGNRPDGPPAGQVLPGQKNVPTGISDRGDGMVTIASSDMSEFWIVTQNTTDGNYELFEVPAFSPGGSTFPSSGAPMNLTENVTASHMAYHPRNRQLAIVPSNNANIQIIDFEEATTTLMFNRAINNSFVPNQTFGGSAGWSFDGTKLFFSRNTATDGNIYRIDLSDSLASVQPVFDTPLAESMSLMLAPDSNVYHIYRETPGSDQILGRINQPDSAITNLMYESALFEGQGLGSNYFSQFMPQNNAMPLLEISVQEGTICMNNPIQFFPSFTPPSVIPTNFEWDFQGTGLTSNLQSPIMSFESAGMVTVTLTAEINGEPTVSEPIMFEVMMNDLQIQLSDTTICPGEVLQLDAEPQQGGQGQQGAGGGPFTYLWNTGEVTPQINVSEAGNYWVVVTPTTGCPVYATAAVEVYGDMNPTANVWYFGNMAGIDFNEEDNLPPPPRSIVIPHAMDAPEGTATISDQNGDVLFYTEGRNVWNRQNDRMPNGGMIGGDSTSTQSVVIVPFPDDETLYYVFTTQEVYGTNEFLMKYSVVDMKEDNGRGDVTQKDITLFTRSTEKLIAYEGGNGFWVMGHEYGNNTFRAYPVTPEGIGSPVLSSAGSVHSINDPFSGQASMKFSRDGRLAVALIEGSDDYVEMFDFDATTGEVTELQYRIDLNEGGGSNADQVYDVHFSNNGNKLFASMNNRSLANPGGRILEYRVDTLSTEDTRLASRTDIAAPSNLNANIGAMQTGPDGQIYVAVEVPGNPAGSAFVGSIVANEDTAATSGFNPQQVILTTGNSRLGLPNFVQNLSTPPQDPNMTVQDTTCTEQRVVLSGVGTSDIDMYAWTIVEAATNTVVFTSVASEPDTAYTWPAGGPVGTYNVSLNIFNRCGFDTTFTRPIQVFDTPDPPSIPSAIAICEGQSNALNANVLGTPGLTFEWRDSQGNLVSNTAEFTVTQPEIYTVTITNAGGCSNSGQVFAGPPFEISLPPAQTICQNDQLILDPFVTASNYIWTVINPDNSTTTLPNQQRATVDSSTPGVFQYVVSIEDPISAGCFVNDTTVVTINPQPMAVLGNVGNATCGATDGSIEFSVTTTGNYSYQVLNNSGGVVSSNPNFTGPGPAPAVMNLAAGIYSVQIIDNSAGCVNTLEDIQIENSPTDFAITSVVETPADCVNPTGSLAVTLSVDIFPISYTLTESSTGATVTGNAGSANAGTMFAFDIDNIPGGTYDLEVTSAGGCTQSQPNVVVTVPNDVDITTEPFYDVCGTQVDLVANSTTPGASFTWTGPAGFAGGTTSSGQTLATTVNGTYTVVASAPGFCDVTETVEVNLSIQPVVQINRVGDECDGTLTLQAEVTNPQPDVSYVYTWSTGASTSSIDVTSDGTYEVTVRESGNLTCTGTANEVVTIPEPLEATLTSTPACDDGQPITLTANITSGTSTGISWTFNDNPFPGSGNTLTVNDEGTYTVTINAGNCFIERSIEVRRSFIPESLVPEAAFYCPTSTPNTILAGRFFTSYEWTFNGQPFPDGGQELTITAPGVYEVTMTTAQGCIRTATMTVIESCDPVVVAPSAIRPSANPPNNTFQVVPNDFVSNFEIFIYNRWGGLIYQSNSLEFSWDGTVGGELVPLGTYPYIIRFTSRFEPERGVFEQFGSVTVIR